MKSTYPVSFFVQILLLVGFLSPPTLGLTCALGQYTKSIWNFGYECVDCSNGMTTTTADAKDCSDCPAGTYSRASTSHICWNCDDGQGSSSRSSSCSACIAGQYSSSTTSHICKACPANTYSSTTVSSACTNCPTGTYTDGVGSSACNCSAGSYFMTLSFCTYCPDGTGTSLPSNTSSMATSCTPCAVGYQSNSTTSHICAPCALNMYNTAALGQSACYNCPVGTVTLSAGSSYCTCSAGKYFNIGGCADCPDGQSSVESTNLNPILVCTPCSEGYQSNSTTSHICKLCVSGTYNNLTTGQTACYACPTGTATAGDGATFCTCAAGYYFDSTGACVACPDGQSANASTTIEPATVCFACEAGFQSNADTKHICQKCAIGSYNNATLGQAQCPTCPTGTGNTASGSTYCTCASGSYFSSGSCVSCLDGATSPESNTTVNINVCTACSLGYASNAATNHQCIECTQPNTYSDSATGQAKCYSCPGESWNTAGGTVCYCNRGHYFAFDGKCKACPDGTTAANSTTQQPIIVCTPCEEGSFSNSTNDHNCTACLTGTYNNNTIGLGKCYDCPSGSNSVAASSFCTCAAGRYFAPTNGACVACPKDKTSLASTTANHTDCFYCGDDQIIVSAICVYSQGCYVLCENYCTEQVDFKACFGGCKVSAVAKEVSDGVVSCTCGDGTFYFNGSCVPVLTSNCYTLCGAKGCIVTQSASSCISCSSGPNVNSTSFSTGLHQCQCKDGTELLDQRVCGYTSGCSSRCVRCTAQADSSSCLECASGLTAVASSAYTVACTCPTGMVYYKNGTCIATEASACFTLCGDEGCIESDNAEMCVGTCKNASNVVTTVLYENVTKCGCADGYKLNSLGECVLDVECDSLCLKCQDADTCLECPDKEGMVLSSGKCICSIADGYVMLSSSSTCVKKTQAAAAAASAAAYLLF